MRSVRRVSGVLRTRGALGIGLGLALITAAPGCDGDDEGDGDELSSEDETEGAGDDSGSGGEALDCEEAPVITYDTFGRGFLSTYCNGCHGGDVAGEARQKAPPEVVFDDPEGTDLFADRILARTLPEDGSPPTMPPAGGITPDDLERVEIWLTCYP